MLFRHGKRIGLMHDNPATEVKKPRAAKKSVYTLDVEEIARLQALEAGVPGDCAWARVSG
jgi:site-specific recombinase XerC